MSDYIVSLIRTYVPMAVGFVAAWLLTLGIEIDSAALELALVSILSGAYYALIRWAESRWPWFGKLLGKQTAPTYDI
jgi:hypothetical protein